MTSQRQTRVHRAPRSVVAYHGCAREVAERIAAGEVLLPSTRRYDWLGVGIYFWEYGPYRAREWAVERFGADAAMLEATIRLGRCLNLLDMEHHAGFVLSYERAAQNAIREAAPLPTNTHDGRHYRDRHIIELFCQSYEAEEGVRFETVRACFPEGAPLFPGSALLSRTHVQLAVRNPECITRLRRVGWV